MREILCYAGPPPGQRYPFEEDLRGPPARQSGQGFDPGEAQSALQAALLCQILQHSRHQSQQQEQERLLDLARQNVAMLASGAHGAQATGVKPGNADQLMEQHMGVWRAQQQSAGSGPPGQGRAAEPGSSAPAVTVSLGQPSQPMQASAPQYNPAAVTIRTTRAGLVPAPRADPPPPQPVHASAARVNVSCFTTSRDTPWPVFVMITELCSTLDSASMEVPAALSVRFEGP